MKNAIDIAKLLPGDGFGFCVSEVSELAERDGIRKGDFVICRRKPTELGQWFVGAIGKVLHLRRLVRMEQGGQMAISLEGDQLRYVAKVVTIVRHFEG